MGTIDDISLEEDPKSQLESAYSIPSTPHKSTAFKECLDVLSQVC
ncbi:hypothetical protein RLOatenuis_0350 [Rickettsiales bacterium]|nr:hypothetical protein RLOatenuis_0350 [Rickettsiales bacterium]